MIFELLKSGRKTKTELSNLTGLNDREIARQVEHERQAGAIILSDSGCAGYYLPSNMDEVQTFVGSMDRRAKRIMLSTRSARRYLKKHADDLSGQLELRL